MHNDLVLQGRHGRCHNPPAVGTKLDRVDIFVVPVQNGDQPFGVRIPNAVNVCIGGCRDSPTVGAVTCGGPSGLNIALATSSWLYATLVYCVSPLDFPADPPGSTSRNCVSALHNPLLLQLNMVVGTTRSIWQCFDGEQSSGGRVAPGARVYWRDRPGSGIVSSTPTRAAGQLLCVGNMQRPVSPSARTYPAARLAVSRLRRRETARRLG
jgi:hypothetical protein